MIKKTIIWLGIFVIVLAGAYFAYSKISSNNNKEKKDINSFDECVDAGYPIQESYPPVCISGDNKSFTQDIGNELEKQNLITIENPRPNAVVTSPLTITGEARGNWFFEASFPVKLYDGNNQLIASGTAQTQGDWMTNDFVEYYAELKFNNPATEKGTLVLEKDNPSDLPENDDQLTVPILFK